MPEKRKKAFGCLAGMIVLLGGTTAVAVGLFPPWRLKVTEYTAPRYVHGSRTMSAASERTYYERMADRPFIGDRPAWSYQASIIRKASERGARVHFEPQINFWQLHLEWMIVLISVVALIVSLYLCIGGRGRGSGKGNTENVEKPDDARSGNSHASEGGHEENVASAIDVENQSSLPASTESRSRQPSESDPPPKAPGPPASGTRDGVFLFFLIALGGAAIMVIPFILPYYEKETTNPTKAIETPVNSQPAGTEESRPWWDNQGYTFVDEDADATLEKQRDVQSKGQTTSRTADSQQPSDDELPAWRKMSRPLSYDEQLEAARAWERQQMVEASSGQTQKERTPPFASTTPSEGWQGVMIEGLGTIDIPNALEVQSDEYAQFAGRIWDEFSLTDETAKKIEKARRKEAKAAADIPGTLPEGQLGRVVLQPAGMNVFDPKATEHYFRIIIETDRANIGDVGGLDDRLDLSELELDEASKMFESSIPPQFRNTVIEHYPAQVAKAGAADAVCVGYRRRGLRGPVVVTKYMVQNYDRMHFLTISYRESEGTIWRQYVPAILSSLRFSHVNGGKKTGADTSTYMTALIYGLIFGLILSWSVGVAPALVYRYAIFRRPIEKKKVFWRLAPCVVVLMFAFKLTMAELDGTAPNPNPVPWIIIYYIGKWIMTRKLVTTQDRVATSGLSQAPPASAFGCSHLASGDRSKN